MNRLPQSPDKSSPAKVRFLNYLELSLCMKLVFHHYLVQQLLLPLHRLQPQQLVCQVCQVLIRISAQ
jgi:hypothetical protein